MMVTTPTDVSHFAGVWLEFCDFEANTTFRPLLERASDVMRRPGATSMERTRDVECRPCSARGCALPSCYSSVGVCHIIMWPPVSPDTIVEPLPCVVIDAIG